MLCVCVPQLDITGVSRIIAGVSLDLINIKHYLNSLYRKLFR